MERPELALGARGARAGAPQPGARAESATGGHVGITFAGSPRHTLGVEIEVGIVSEATGALVGAAPRVLAEVLPVPRGRFAPEAKKELFDSTLELTTGVCATTAQVRADLRRALALPSSVLRRDGLALMSAGLHPFSSWAQQQVMDDERYRLMIAREQWPVRRLTTYGLHIHVGVPSAQHAIACLTGLAPLAPHLLALSASSPFRRGHDTGLASVRNRLWASVPRSGPPPPMRDWSQFEALAALLQASGSIASPRDLWWDLRPSAELGTVELRMCDAVSTLDEVAALAAFAQAAVAACCRAHDEGEPMPGQQEWMIRENTWRAARAGTEAQLVLPDGRVRPLAEDILDWVDQLRPTAAELGGRDDLDRIAGILGRGAGHSRQRAVLAARGSMRDVVRHLVAELRGDPVDLRDPARSVALP